MIPASFDYSSPKTLSEAISLLAKHGADAKILAGGQSLIPLMKMRLAGPKHLIDLNGIGDLSYIKEADGHLTIGAMTREADLDSSDLIKKKYPILADTAAVAVQITLDGNNIKSVGIGLTNVGMTPIKAVRAEKALQGKPADPKNIEEAARIASEEADPSDDLRGSVDYKRSLIRVLTTRALHQAIARAKGEH